MKYASINIQGNIISSDVITKIAQDEERYQKQPDFGLDRNTAVREEIGIAWAAAKSHWKAFKLRRDRLKEKDTGTSETRRSWMIPLLQELGYDLESGKAEMINGKSYAISHRALNRDGFPVHIVGVNQSMDKRAEHGTRLSPHALTQEYLNNHEYLYAVTTNGRFLRLLRDATRLSRLSYLEFDLEQMMEEDLYAEFAIFFRLLHVTRMPEKEDVGEDSIIEYYHQEALSSGTRIRERLSLAVEDSIRSLANGLLQQSQNEALQRAIRDGDLKADEYYLYMLRTIYRMLFLLVIEDRNLIYPEKRDEELNRKRKIYYDYYSLQRLTRMAERRVYVDPRKTDLWQSLLTTFSLFEKGAFGQKLGIEPLGSGLFSPAALGLVSQSEMNNETLMEVLRNLVLFENENKQITRVNYADLDVEEFGSVYEGLLEYDPVIDIQPTSLNFSFAAGDGRSSSGSHYTPGELVKPLIKHSLDYIIADKLKEGKAKGGDTYAQMQAQCDALLTITVCDVACGSGHILLSAARRIGMELAVLRESIASKSEVEQPSPPFMRQAVRDVIQHCIYGVDLNPLAVELCKVAFWLEAHNPGEPLNFLDHHIKNGNAIVGLAHFEELQNGIANEAFKALPGDDKTLASELKKKNTLEKKTSGQLSTYNIAEVDNSLKGLQKDFANFVALPEDTPTQIKAKTKAYQELTTGKKWYRLKNLADLQVAQFFIPKTLVNKEKLTTEAKYRTHLNVGTQILDRGASMAMAAEKRFFHWFLEFPEVFGKGGFDCILGNPPYLGGQKISGHYGYDFLNYLKDNFAPAKSCDLIAFFLRRIFSIIRDGGFLSILSTNTIAEGKTREGSLAYIVNNGGSINFAFRSKKWPGIAAVEVTQLSLYKGEWKDEIFLDNQVVHFISSYLDHQEQLGEPEKLQANKGKAYQGSIVLGKGFILNREAAVELLNKNKDYQKVLLPYLDGSDLNKSPDYSADRYAINFFNWELEKCRMDYPQLLDYVRTNVKPQRESIITEKKAKNIQLGIHDKRAVEEWWLYLWPRPELYSSIDQLQEILVTARVSKSDAFAFTSNNQVFTDQIIAFTLDQMSEFSIMQSNFQVLWAWKNSSTIRGIGLRYSITGSFERFPFPKPTKQIKAQLDNIGTEYYDLRKWITTYGNIGLTEIYNQIHNSKLFENIEHADKKEITKKYNKATWQLFNHLELEKKSEIPFYDMVSAIKNLRELHFLLDEAVLAAYGWHEDSVKWGKAIDLRHDFYAVDYLPENDRVRYTIHPEARKEVLKRLLLLNHERFEEEVAQGLHKRKDVEAYYQQKGKAIPEGTVFSDSKGSTKKKPATQARSTKQSVPNDSPDLFSTQAASSGPVKVGSQVTIRKPDGKVFCYHILKKAVKGEFTGSHKHINSESGLAQAMLGKSVGDGFEFGTIEYSIIRVE